MRQLRRWSVFLALAVVYAQADAASLWVGTLRLEVERRSESPGAAVAARRSYLVQARLREAGSVSVLDKTGAAVGRFAYLEDAGSKWTLSIVGGKRESRTGLGYEFRGRY